MAFQLPPIRAEIVFDKSSFDRGLAQAKRQTDSTARAMSASFGGLEKTVRRVGFALAGLFTVQAARSFLRAGDSLERIQISLRGLLGSTEAADKAFRAIENLAAELPQGINDLAEAFVNLETAGVASIKNLELVSDAATVMNRSVVDVSLALRSLEIEPLRNAFGFQEASVAAGKFFAVTREGTKIQAKSRQEFRAAILDYLQYSKFSGAARQASGTFASSVETIGNTIAKTSLLVRSVLAPALDVLARKFKEVGDKFENFLKSPSGKDPKKTNLQVLQESFKEFTEEKVLSGLKQIAKDIETIAKSINEMDASKLSELSALAKLLAGGGATAVGLKGLEAFSPLLGSALTLGGQAVLERGTRRRLNVLTGPGDDYFDDDVPLAGQFKVPGDAAAGGAAGGMAAANASAKGFAATLRKLVGRAGLIALVGTAIGFVVKSVLEALGVTIEWKDIWEKTKTVVSGVFGVAVKGAKTLVIALQASMKGLELIIDTIVLSIAKAVQSFAEMKREGLRALGDVAATVNETAVGDFLVPDDALYGPNGIEQRAADAGTAAAKAAKVVESAYKELNEDSQDVFKSFDELVNVWGDIPPVVNAIGGSSAEAAPKVDDLSKSLGNAAGGAGGVAKEFESATESIKSLMDEIEDLEIEKRLFNASDLEKQRAEFQAEYERFIRDLGDHNISPASQDLLGGLASERLRLQIENASRDFAENGVEAVRDMKREIEDLEIEKALLNADDFTRELVAIEEEFRQFSQDLANEENLSPEAKSMLLAIAGQRKAIKIEIAQESQSQLAAFGRDLDSAVAQGFSSGFSAVMESGDWKSFFSSLGESVFNAIAENAAQALVQGLGFNTLFQDLFSGKGGNGGSVFGAIGGFLSSLFGGGRYGGVVPHGLRHFATGGVVPNLGRPFADSVPALLMPGERVLTREQNRDMEKGMGGQAPSVVFNVQAIDAQSFQEWLVKEQETVVALVAGNQERNGRMRSAAR